MGAEDGLHSFWLSYGEYRGARNIKAFMRYVMEAYREYRYTKAYRFYVTDSLANIPQNKYINIRYCDMLKPKFVDNRTGDEIAEDVITRLGLRFDE